MSSMASTARNGTGISLHQTSTHRYASRLLLRLTDGERRERINTIFSEAARVLGVASILHIMSLSPTIVFINALPLCRIKLA